MLDDQVKTQYDIEHSQQRHRVWILGIDEFDMYLLFVTLT